MNILTEDEALKIFKAEDSIANDEERWVTMNGRHVLIRNGEPVGLNIQSAKKFKSGPRSVKELVKKYKDEGKTDLAGMAEILRGKMASQGLDVHQAVSNEMASLEAQLEKGWIDRDSYERSLKLLDEVSGEAWSANERGKKGDRFYGKFGKLKNKTEEIHRLDADKIDFDNQQKEKFDRLDRRTGKSFEKMRENIRNGVNKDIAKSFHRDRLKKIDKEETKLMNQQANEDRIYEKRRSAAQKETNKFNAAKQALSKARPKIQSAREANRYLAERSNNIKKATPDMVGGRFNNEKKEIKNNVKEFSNVSRRMDRENKKSWNQYQKEMDEINKKQDNLRNKSISKNIGLGNAAVRLAGLNGEKYKSLIHRITERQNRLGQQYLEQQKDLLEQANRSNERHSQRINANNKEVDKAAEEMNKKNAKTVRKYDAIKSFLDEYRSKRK